jgi:hypothetical protein
MPAVAPVITMLDMLLYLSAIDEQRITALPVRE